MSLNPASVDICVCTFQRPEITRLLRSIAAMERPSGISLRVVVADNDHTPSAQVMVRAAAAELGLTLHYVHAPARNISIARNACLDAATADYIAFIDDDQICDIQWLKHMLHRFALGDADILVGPVIAMYPHGCAHWLLEGDFHSNYPAFHRGKIYSCYTGNVLMRRATPALADLRFDEALGLTGGEDTVYFFLAQQAGARIAYEKHARIHEPVPEQRTTMRWLMKRRLRYGQTHALTLRLSGRGGLLSVAVALIKALYCFVMALLCLLHPVNKRGWLLRGMLHLGVVQQLLVKR